MGWYNYYNLLAKYKGDLSKAKKSELEWAAHCNPDNPPDALALARRKYAEEKQNVVRN